MPVRVTRSAAAEDDIREILVYTIDKWGIEQAVRYADLIEEAIETIATDPTAGRERFEVRDGILAHHIAQRGRNASHLLYYRVVLGAVQLVRVLHERMDPDLHL